MKVVDASAFAALIFEEPEAEEIARRLQGDRLVAPVLLKIELASVCLTKCRRYPEAREALVGRLERGLLFPIAEMSVDHIGVLVLAVKRKLSAYDATYLWLALRLDAELVTLDKALARAWDAERRATKSET